MRVLNKIKTFLRDSQASVSLEAVLVFPLLIWAYFGMFTLFDGYRALSSNIRASYTISELLSRGTDQFVDEAYLAGLNDMLDVLTQSSHRTVLRVTVVQWDENNDSHILQWSESTPGKSGLTEADMATKIEPYMPPMPNGSELIMVETWMAFVPFMNITLEPFYFEALTVIRPRGPQLKWNGA